ncbi:hypothetical protein GGI12_000594 [Dipsacomyces acuminosporus]|nr:hypothetical protein GGI12_000594 [Dipsacomyces acuminosporus]
MHGSDYFGAFAASHDTQQPRNSMDDVDMQSLSFNFPANLHGLEGAGVAASGTGNPAGVYPAGNMSTPGGDIDHRVHLMTSMRQPVQMSATSDSLGINGAGIQQFLPFTAPPPVPPLLQPQTPTNAALANISAEASTVSSRRPHALEKDALSFTLGNVAIAMAKKDVDSEFVQSTLDHLSYVTKNISSASQEALEQAKEAAAEAVATIDAGAAADRSQDEVKKPACTPIHESLLRMERRVELAEKAVHNYFCFIHHQCPIIHKPSFLRQIREGTISHFVWFSLRALAARTLLHSQALSEAEVLIEEEYFATKAHVALSTELSKPSVEVVQGLALLSLYVFGTPRWQEASMYWCKATRLAQLMEFHAIDAPTRAIATKLHFGIFEPPKKGTTHRDDLALIPGDFSGDHVPLSQALTPLEAELRRRLWWMLFTNERFCSISERLPTMVNEARMFVHFPCSAKEWDQPEFTYQAPERVPRYLREGYTRAQPGDDLNRLTLGQEMSVRKGDNLYLMSEIEYGFSMSHLVAFLADMSSLFRPRSPYGNDYIPVFMQMTWPNKMKTLRANVERVERIFEMVRQDILQRLAMPSSPNTSSWTPQQQQPEGTSNVPSKADSEQEDKTGTRIDPVLDSQTYAPGIEIPHLHQLSMLILYSVLNIHLYRMVFQIHYEFSSSLPPPAKREQEDNELLAAFGQYVKDLWLRTTTAAQQVSRILRGEYPGVPHWVLTLAGIKKPSPLAVPAATQSPVTGPDPPVRASNGEMMEVDADSNRPPQERARQRQMQRLKEMFQERIRAQEAHLHEVANSVFSSFRRTLPYALLLAAKVHIDNIEWWANEKQVDKMARAYLDLAEIVRFLETHQVAFASTDYVSLVKGMMHADMAQQPC